ncbi:dihydropteroate synthase [Devosia enhydra]|nr:dihydropteroate synthase [Devosia enhydra]
MGILNLTPDSFSDGGQHEGVDAGLVHAAAMVAEGADILDIGGESTRPGATLVPVQDELDRVVPALLALRASGMTLPISIDTYKPLVAHQALEAGADIINDVHGLQRAPEMAEIAALFGAPVIVMHWDEKRDPARDIMSAILAFFERSLRIAEAAGLERDKLILDPGFGFGKSLDENYAILRRLGELHVLGLPVLAGTSRKSMIGRLLDKPTDQRLSGTLATSVIAYGAGAHIFRVHDVAANRDALRVAHATAYGLEGA